MRTICFLAAPAVMLMLPGCIAKTALDVATMPVRAGAQAADWATTSQDEADRNYGRRMRKEAQEAQEAQEAREYKKAEEQRRRECRRAGYEDCD